MWVECAHKWSCCRWRPTEPGCDGGTTSGSVRVRLAWAGARPGQIVTTLTFYASSIGSTASKCGRWALRARRGRKGRPSAAGSPRAAGRAAGGGTRGPQRAVRASARVTTDHADHADEPPTDHELAADGFSSAPLSRRRCERAPGSSGLDMPRPAQSASPTCEVYTRAVRVGPEPRSRLSTSAAPRRRAARALRASPEARPSLQVHNSQHDLQSK